MDTNKCYKNPGSCANMCTALDLLSSEISWD